MESKKYPIGTKVVFIANESMCYQARQDDGKIGEVIGEVFGNVRIFLSDSVKGHGCGYWNTEWKNIKPLVVKGQQLLFAFMEE